MYVVNLVSVIDGGEWWSRFCVYIMTRQRCIMVRSNGKRCWLCNTGVIGLLFLFRLAVLEACWRAA